MNKSFRVTNIIVACLSFYSLSALTNVMVLGSFTESWLKSFHWTRGELSQMYSYATLCVASTVGFAGLCFEKFGFKKTCFYTLLCLALFSFWLSKLAYVSAIKFTCLLFLMQWFGQGLLVVTCRSSLMVIAPLAHRGIFAGIQESLGTLSVNTFTFVLLYLNHKYPWTQVLQNISVLYFIAALLSLILGPVPITPKQASKSTPWYLLKSKRFWLINGLINLPILINSGFFFHLEAICQLWKIDIHTLRSLVPIQILGIICVHLLLGSWVSRKTWKLQPLLWILVGSQCMWYLGLSHQLLNSFWKSIYLIGNSIGLGSFGILVNVTWRSIYGNHANSFCIGWAVCLGFIFNALGPLLFNHLL